MTEAEYFKARIYIQDQVIHELIAIVGGAIPLTQGKLIELRKEWKDSLVVLEEKASGPTIYRG